MKFFCGFPGRWAPIMPEKNGDAHRKIAIAAEKACHYGVLAGEHPAPMETWLSGAGKMIDECGSLKGLHEKGITGGFGLGPSSRTRAEALDKLKALAEQVTKRSGRPDSARLVPAV